MKLRTTIYISESAKAKIDEYKINLSQFVEEMIFNNFGYSASLAELEAEIRETSEKLEKLNTKRLDFSAHETNLDKYLDMIVERHHAFKGQKTLEWIIFSALRAHLKDKPMCDMSRNQILAKCQERLNVSQNSS